MLSKAKVWPWWYRPYWPIQQTPVQGEKLSPLGMAILNGGVPLKGSVMTVLNENGIDPAQEAGD